MLPPRQSRSIASPDARDFDESSAGPSDAPHVRRQATRESRGALCHKFHSHPPLAVGATKKSAAPIQSSFDPFFFRLRSMRARSARVGVSMSEACASFVRKSW